MPEDYTADGVSQVQTLKGEVAPLREKPLFWKSGANWPPQKNRPDHWVSYAVVHQKWKLVSNRDADHIELCDISADPFEKNDLKSSKPELVAVLLD